MLQNVCSFKLENNNKVNNNVRDIIDYLSKQQKFQLTPVTGYPKRTLQNGSIFNVNTVIYFFQIKGDISFLDS